MDVSKRKRVLSILIIVCASVLLFAPCVLSETSTSVSLSAGRNLISFPELPQDKRVAAVFADVLPQVRIIWGFDNITKAWKSYRPGTKRNSLLTVEGGKGYEVYMNAGGTIDTTGWIPQSDKIALYKGWNLAGYNGPLYDDTDSNAVAKALAGIFDRWSIIKTWKEGTWYANHATKNLPSPSISALKHGIAYWIEIKAKPTTYWNQSAQYSEDEYAYKMISALIPGAMLKTTLESPYGPIPSDQQDTAHVGQDQYRMFLRESMTVDPCFLAKDKKHIMQIYDMSGSKLSSMVSKSPPYDCSGDNIAPVTLSAGTHYIKIIHDRKTNVSDTVRLYFVDSPDHLLQSGAPSTTLMVNALPSNDSDGGNSTSYEQYSFTKDYGAGPSIVSYKATLYKSKWWPAVGQCPVVSDCKSAYKTATNPTPQQWDSAWGVYDPQADAEAAAKLAAYNKKYSDVTIPSLDQCALNAGETTLAYVERLIAGRLGQQGELGALALTATEKAAMKRAYYLPCEVPFTVTKDANGRVSTTDNDKATWPQNVVTVNAIMPETLWNEISAQKFSAGEKRTGPVDTSTFTYENLLRQIARAPYFCGETGPFYTELKESCARELAALLAHATQETGFAGTYGSLLAFTREDGAYPFAPVGANYWKAGTCNASPLHCPADEIPYYYGRGMHQTTWYYNYVNLAAAYFGGSHYDFLINYPDLVGRKGGLAFASGIVFAVTPVTPKPSMHEVMLGLDTYQPTGCDNDTACGGLVFDQGTKMVKDPFLVTTSIINGQYECTYPGDNETSQMVQSRNRTKVFVTLLGKFLGGNQSFSDDEMSLCIGSECQGCNLKAGDVFGNNPKMQDKNKMFIDFSQSTCPAVDYSVNPPLSFYYDGILNLCKAMNQ
jgi:hypothetical protein